MGFLDQLTGGVAGNLFGGTDKNKLFESIMGMINSPRTGGKTSLLGRTVQQRR